MQYSKQFKTVKNAQQWAYNRRFKDIMYLIHDKEDNKYQFVNEDRLFYLKNCYVLDMRIIELWE